MILKKIVLLGMMGSGKSTIGKFLSKKTKMSFFDTDTIIEKECKLKIKKIFDIYGKQYFTDTSGRIGKVVLSW